MSGVFFPDSSERLVLQFTCHLWVTACLHRSKAKIHIFQVSSKPRSSFRHLKKSDRSFGEQQAPIWYCYINIPAFSKAPLSCNVWLSWAASKLSNTGEVLREQVMHCTYTFFSLLFSKSFTDIPEFWHSNLSVRQTRYKCLGPAAADKRAENQGKPLADFRLDLRVPITRLP